MGSKSFIFCFDDVEVREREFTLVKAGKTLAVEPKGLSRPTVPASTSPESGLKRRAT